jgi:hypothetical protein
MKMNTSLHSPNAESGYTEFAIVKGGFSRDYMVQSKRGVYRAKLAFSCFVAPEVGDKVLVNVTESESHVIAIIERFGELDAKLSFPANATLETKAGDISIVSHGNINQTAVGEAKIFANDISMISNETKVQSDKMSLSGNTLSANWQSIQSIADVVTSTANKLIKAVKNSFTTVENVEHKTSKNYVQNVSETTSIRSRNAIVTAEKDMKIDGERIHMG